MKKSNTFKKIYKNHQEYVKTASWCEIVDQLIDLEQERHSLKELLTHKILNQYDQLIELYEDAKLALYPQEGRSFQESVQVQIDGIPEDVMIDIGEDFD